MVCEPEHAPLLFESNEETEESNHINDSEQPQDLMVEASNETLRSCVFKTNNLCMAAGLEEYGQSFKALKNMEEYLPEYEIFEVEYDNETGEEIVHYNEQV